MNRRQFLLTLAAAGGGLWGAATAAAAHAQTDPANPAARELRLVFSRADGLFVTDSEIGENPRRVLTVPARSLWAISPDGRRVAWVSQPPAVAAEDGFSFGKRPATVFLSDLTGRHQKRLFSTRDLRDRLGRTVSQVSIPAPNGSAMEKQGLLSLAWSGDGRTLYLSCGAAFAVDAATGTAVVDAEGRWKAVTTLYSISAQNNLLVGLEPVRPLPNHAEYSATDDTGAIFVVNLAAGTKTALFPPWNEHDDKPPPEGELARNPMLGPDHRTIAYGSGFPGGGLWLLDRLRPIMRGTNEPRRVVEDDAARPVWSGDGKSLYFLRRPDIAKPTQDLYNVAIAPDPAATVAPRRVLQNVDWFDLVPF